MAAININVNLQQTIKNEKNSLCLKRQETSLHINDSPRSDLCKSWSINDIHNILRLFDG